MEPKPKKKYGGFATYGEYLRGPHWKRMRAHFCLREACRCYACKADKLLQIHHLRYHNLGREEAKDFVILCDSCHHKVHKALDGMFPDRKTGYKAKRTKAVFDDLFGVPLHKAVADAMHAESYDQFCGRKPKQPKAKTQGKPDRGKPRLCRRCGKNPYGKKQWTKMCGPCRDAVRRERGRKRMSLPIGITPSQPLRPRRNSTESILKNIAERKMLEATRSLPPADSGHTCAGPGPNTNLGPSLSKAPPADSPAGVFHPIQEGRDG
jgi:hypothetical protein